MTIIFAFIAIAIEIILFSAWLSGSASWVYPFAVPLLLMFLLAVGWIIEGVGNLIRRILP